MKRTPGRSVIVSLKITSLSEREVDTRVECGQKKHFMENFTDVFSSHFVNKKGGSLKILVEGNISKGQQGSERFNFYFGADL